MTDHDTTQGTLTGDPQTRPVNQQHTDHYDVDIGRADAGQSHLLNTEPGDPGWLDNPHFVEATTDRKCPLCNTYHTCGESIEAYRDDFHDRLNEDRVPRGHREPAREDTRLLLPPQNRVTAT